jgi:hypothetical protein
MTLKVLERIYPHDSIFLQTHCCSRNHSVPIQHSAQCIIVCIDGIPSVSGQYSVVTVLKVKDRAKTEIRGWRHASTGSLEWLRAIPYGQFFGEFR